MPSANNDRNAVYESIDSNPKYNNVREWLEYQDTRPGKHPDRPEDIAYDAYISSIVLNEKFENELGQRDWEAVAAAEQDFRVEYGDETYAYVRILTEVLLLKLFLLVLTLTDLRFGTKNIKMRVVKNNTG